MQSDLMRSSGVDLYRRMRGGAGLRWIAILSIIFTMLFTMLFSWPYVSASGASGEPPVIIRATWKAGPGQVLEINGGSLGTTEVNGQPAPKVAIQPLSLLTGPLLPEDAPLDLELITAQDHYLQGLIPANAPKDVYAAWVKTQVGWSEPVFINRAEPFWLSDRIAYPGQQIRVFGRNFLNPSTGAGNSFHLKMVSVSNGTKIEAQVVQVSEFAADFVLPEGVVTGESYSVSVSNGAGGELGYATLPEEEALIQATEKGDNVDYFARELGVQAAWLEAVPHNQQFNAKDYNAKGDGVTDDTSAIQAALDEADNLGGGIVHLEKGIYLFSELTLPGNTILRGDGPEDTVLRYKGGSLPADQNKPNWNYGEAIILLHSTEDAVGIVDLAVESTEHRPASDSRRRLNGWVNPIGLGYDEQYKIGDTYNQINRGYLVKNVKIRNADGAGIQTVALSDVIIEDNDIVVTHSGVQNYIKEKAVRVLDNIMFNTQRPLIMPGLAAWVEGNQLSAQSCNNRTDIGCEPPPTVTSQEHRIMDLTPVHSYVANNIVTGQFGTTSSDSLNDGEGILWQETKRMVYSKATAATAGGLSDSSKTFAAGSLKGMKVIIVGGKGIGQMRTISAHTEHEITIDRPWQIVPDSSSVYTVDGVVNYHNIVVGNQISSATKKGGIMFYTKSYDNIVANNTLRNTGGIWLSMTQNVNQNRADFSYFDYAAGNTLEGASDPNGHMPNHMTIGPANDGGVMTNIDAVLPSTGLYGNEIKGNSITGIGTNASELYIGNTKFTKKFIDGSGIMVSTGADSSYPLVQGTLVEGNTVTNTIAGVHLANTAYGTLIHDNNFGGNGLAENNVNSIGTIRVDNQHVGPASPDHATAYLGLNGAVSLVWSPVRNADSYTLTRSLNREGPYETVASGLTETNVQDSSADGRPYYYGIVTVDAAGFTSIPNRVQAKIILQTTAAVDTAGRAYSVTIDTYYAYVADYGGGLQIMDIANPDAPVLIGHLDTPGDASNVAVKDNYAYVADQAGGLQIIDVSDPTYPVIAAKANTTQSKDVFLSGNYAYVADGTMGLRIIDISDPLKPVIRSTLAAGNAVSVYVRNSYAYVVSGSTGLRVVDVSNPSRPVIVGALDTAGNAQEIALYGDYAYIADGTTDRANGLQIINIANPASPAAVGTYNTNGAPAAVLVHDNILYVGDYFNNLNLFNLNNPAEPQLVGQIATADNVFGLEVAGERIYMATSYIGLTVYKSVNPVIQLP